LRHVEVGTVYVSEVRIGNNSCQKFKSTFLKPKSATVLRQGRGTRPLGTGIAAFLLCSNQSCYNLIYLRLWHLYFEKTYHHTLRLAELLTHKQTIPGSFRGTPIYGLKGHLD
jgi:hypothetical protein